MIAAMRVIDIVTSDNDKKFEPAARMAASIIQITRATGCCLPQDLDTNSFTPQEVSQHWHLAQSLAAVELNLMKKN